LGDLVESLAAEIRPVRDDPETVFDREILAALRIERNLKVPLIATLLKIARFFDVPMAQLFGETLGNEVICVSRASDRAGHSPTSEAEYRIEEPTSGKGGTGIEGFVMFPPASFPKTDGRSTKARNCSM
jgi:transcriptional regulator with XRE-family HTH domain